jgi:flavin-dependent dehydrogenase
VFLIPGGQDQGWLLAVGDLGDFRSADSRLVGAQIAEVIGEPAQFPSHPRIAWPLCGPGWLACGTGALAFDPLCGDGSGHAVREGILAAAVLRSIYRGGRSEELLSHYRSRLLAGFMRHLATCETFYRTGGCSPWWRQQLEAVRDGLDWRPPEPGLDSSPRFRLRGFDLEPVSVDRPHYSF